MKAGTPSWIRTSGPLSINIEATPERVWQVLSEIERWPEWTPSVLSIDRLEATPLAVGSTVRIRQPKLRPAVWEITCWEPSSRFIWVSSKPGLSVAAEHIIAPRSNGCSTVTVHLQFDGLLGSILGRLTGSLTDRYLALEAAGLKKQSEFRSDLLRAGE